MQGIGKIWSVDGTTLEGKFIDGELDGSGIA